MSITRREIPGRAGGTPGTGAFGGQSAFAAGGTQITGYADRFGVAHDIFLCVGSRQCGSACGTVHERPAADHPFTDNSAMDQDRRPHAESNTDLDRYPGADQKAPLFKKQPAEEKFDV
jgi:hypothetical protein